MALVGVEIPVRLVAEDLAWMDAAACKGLTHLFFAVER